MPRYRTTKTFTPRQPLATGPDVIFNGSDFDAYADGRYLCSRTSSPDAWIEARAAHFDAVEATPTAADAVVLGCLDAFASGWARWAARQVAVVEVDR